MEDVKQLLEDAYETRLKKFGRELHLYYPTLSRNIPPVRGYKPRGFPSFSITGTACTLNCEHCKGKLLDHMIPATTPRRLRDLCFKVHEQGGVGCLVSGGCLPEGAVPLDRFMDAIGDIKRETGLKLVVHTGLAPPKILLKLAETGIDAVSFDLIGSDRVIREIYHLKASVEDYEKAMKLMAAIGLNFAPHILMGLYHGKITEERRALEASLRYGPSSLVFIVFTPIRGTPMESDKPPPIRDVVDIIAYARTEAPDTPIALGCVRPLRGYRDELDQLAIRAGVNGVAHPSESVYPLLPRIGLKPVLHDTCCSLIHSGSQIRQ